MKSDKKIGSFAIISNRLEMNDNNYKFLMKIWNLLNLKNIGKKRQDPLLLNTFNDCPGALLFLYKFFGIKQNNFIKIEFLDICQLCIINRNIIWPTWIFEQKVKQLCKLLYTLLSDTEKKEFLQKVKITYHVKEKRTFFGRFGCIIDPEEKYKYTLGEQFAELFFYIKSL